MSLVVVVHFLEQAMREKGLVQQAPQALFIGNGLGWLQEIVFGQM